MWAGLTHIFSPTFTMNITSGVQIWHETSTNQSIGFNPSTTLGLPAYVNEVDPLFPTVNFGNGISQLGPFSGNTEGVTNHGPIGTVAVDFIKSHGKNTINFGFMGVEAGLRPVQLLLGFPYVRRQLHGRTESPDWNARRQLHR